MAELKSTNIYGNLNVTGNIKNNSNKVVTEEASPNTNTATRDTYDYGDNDLNSLTDTGFYNVGNGSTNNPFNDWAHVIVLRRDSNYILQIAFHMTVDRSYFYWRIRDSGSWSNWNIVGDRSYNDGRYVSTSGDSVSGDYSTTGDIESGRGSGGVALTVNDGYGNANVTWNHRNGVPEQNGNAARIEVNTDNTTGGASMSFELGSSVTAGNATSLTQALYLTENALDVNGLKENGSNTLSNNITGIAFLTESNLASTAAGNGASMIGVEDSAGNFTGTDVEAVLAELVGGGGGISTTGGSRSRLWNLTGTRESENNSWTDMAEMEWGLGSGTVRIGMNWGSSNFLYSSYARILQNGAVVGSFSTNSGDHNSQVDIAVSVGDSFLWQAKGWYNSAFNNGPAEVYEVWLDVYEWGLPVLTGGQWLRPPA